MSRSRIKRDWVCPNQSRVYIREVVYIILYTLERVDCNRIGHGGCFCCVATKKILKNKKWKMDARCEEDENIDRLLYLATISLLIQTIEVSIEHGLVRTV